MPANLNAAPYTPCNARSHKIKDAIQIAVLQPVQQCHIRNSKRSKKHQRWTVRNGSGLHKNIEVLLLPQSIHTFHS